MDQSQYLETTNFTFTGPDIDGSLAMSLVRCRPTLPPSASPSTRRVVLLTLHAVGSRKL